MALDKVPAAMMSPMDSASETAPSNPNVGQRWFRLSTGVTYQYTNDGTSSFWLDVSSGGIGTSNYRAVNFVGDTDPHPRSNIAGADVGAIYYNREGNRYFELMDATNNVNVWRGSYSVVGGTVHTYIASNVTYRIHVFWADTAYHNVTARATWPTQTNHMLYLDKSVSTDVLMVAGGGGGGGEFGGGGGGGGVLYASGRTIPAGSYIIKVGVGGRNGLQSGQQAPHRAAMMGGTTTAFGATIYGGGPGGGRSFNWDNTASGTQNAHVRTNMANGGGTAPNSDATAEAGTATSSSGFVGSGGSFTTSGGYTGGQDGGDSSNFPAGGGAGAAANGVSPSSASQAGGNGGNGIQVGAGIYDNVNNYWWAGGGGGGTYNTAEPGGNGGNGGGGGGASFASGAGGVGHRGGISPGQQSGIGNAYKGGDGGRGTGGGGGGSTHQYGVGGVGGSGIVIVKYAIN